MSYKVEILNRAAKATEDLKTHLMLNIRNPYPRVINRVM